jgi:hypothetical protein
MSMPHGYASCPRCPGCSETLKICSANDNVSIYLAHKSANFLLVLFFRGFAEVRKSANHMHFANPLIDF